MWLTIVQAERTFIFILLNFIFSLLVCCDGTCFFFFVKIDIAKIIIRRTDFRIPERSQEL